MSWYLVDQIYGQDIDVRLGTVVAEVHSRPPEAITSRTPTPARWKRYQQRTLFVFIGAVPHTDLVAGRNATRLALS